MKGLPLEGRVAVVAGASRGAGRGIALALGEAGATVYVAARTARGGPPPADGAPGTVDDTAEELTVRGGTGIAVKTDLTSETEVAALFARVEKEQGRLDVLANAAYGAGDSPQSADGMMAAWGQPFWVQNASWRDHVTAGAGAYYLASKHAVPLMLKGAKRRGAPRGLIAGVTDCILPVDGEDADTTAWAPEQPGNLLWGLAHRTINSLMRSMSLELKKHEIAVATLMPGFMRTERVMRVLTSEEMKRQFRLDLSESTLYIGRAVAALASDRNAMQKSGRVHFVADLAEEYGFTDEDGRRVARFRPFA